MKGYIVGIVLGLCMSAYASYQSYSARKISVSGKTCIIVQTNNGVGLSCDWSRNVR